MRKKILALVASSLFIIAPIFAQPQNPQNDVDNRVPIGGIEILLTAGAFFGIRWIILKNRVSPSERIL